MNQSNALDTLGLGYPEKPPEYVEALKELNNALRNYTRAQERLTHNGKGSTRRTNVRANKKPAAPSAEGSETAGT